MVFRRSMIVLLLLPFILAGCFRQASDSFDAVDDTDADQQTVQETLPPDNTDNDAPPTLDLGGGDVDDDMTDDEMATPTEMSMDDTDNDAPPTLDFGGGDDNNATGDDSNLPTLGAPVTQTPVAPQVDATPTTNIGQSADDTDDDTDAQSPGASPTFITPGAPTRQPGASTPTPSGNDTATPSGLITPTDFLNPNNVSAECLYIVQPGDNLFRIAINNGTTLEQLRAANPQVRGDVIQPGDQLILPVGGCEGAEVSEDPADDTGGTVQQPTTVPGQTIHTVSSGETLSIIARRYGATITEIVQANSLTNPDRLSIGQQLIIPVGGN